MSLISTNNEDPVKEGIHPQNRKSDQDAPPIEKISSFLDQDKAVVKGRRDTNNDGGRPFGIQITYVMYCTCETTWYFDAGSRSLSLRGTGGEIPVSSILKIVEK